MSLDKRRLKSEIIESLREVPFINHTAKKTGVSRMTFYRWLEKDKTFRYNINAALQEGHKNMIEVAESALFKKIRDGHFGSIKLYLENNHGNYMTRRYSPRSTSDRITEDSRNPFYERVPQVLVLDEYQTQQMEKLHEMAERYDYSREETDTFIDMIKDGTFDQYLKELGLKYQL